MLEGLAGWLLKTYIGKYVHLNTEKLSVGLLSGYLELENLPLRKDAFNKYNNLPFVIKFGHIDKIKLNISLNKFSKTPWSLVVAGIHIILSIKHSSLIELNEAIINTETNLVEKLKILDLLEAKWLDEIELLNETSSTSTQQQSKWFSFASIAYNMLKNIKVSFENIHVRFESHGFSIGLQIDSIYIKNQDQIDEHDPPDAFLKLFELSDLSLYVDKMKIFNDDSQDSTEIIKKMNELNLSAMGYIIKPTSFKLKLTRYVIEDSNPKRGKKSNPQPKIKILATIDELEFNFDNDKINYFLEIARAIKFYNKKCEIIKSLISHNEYKINNARFLWNYAFKRIKNRLKLENRKPKISQFLNQWSQDVNLYKKIFFKINEQMLAHESMCLNDEELKVKERIEAKWSLSRLKVLRRAIFEYFIESKKYKESERKRFLRKKNETSGVYGYLLHQVSYLKNVYYSTSVPQIEDNKQLDDEVAELINDSIRDETILRHDVFVITLEFKLKNSTIQLFNEEKINFVELKFNSSDFNVDLRPNINSYLISLNFLSLHLIDKFNKNSSFSYLIQPKTQQHNVLHLTYEYNPLSLTKRKDFNARLVVKSNGLDIVYNYKCYEQLIKFFRIINTYKKRHVSREVSESRMQVTSTQKTIDSFLEMNLKYFDNMQFEIEIFAPNFILPMDINNKNTEVIVIDFGLLTFFHNRYEAKQAASPITNDSMDVEEDDVFETPLCSPSDLECQLNDSQVQLSSFQDYVVSPKETQIRESQKSVVNKQLSIPNDENIKAKYYSNYLLNLSDLQMVNTCLSKQQTLANTLKKGKSDHHLLEKFDIKIAIKVCKLKLDDALTNNDSWPFLNVHIGLNHIKMHADPFKLGNLINILLNLSKFINENEVNETTVHQKCVESSISSYGVFSFSLDEFDLTLSNMDSQNLTTRSIAEIQLNQVKCELIQSFGRNINSVLKFSIFSLLIIDARQIYGEDYHLMATSHSQIHFDKSSGVLQHHLNEYSSEALISIIIEVNKNDEGTNNFFIKSIFNSLDVILNPETISELIILAYTVSLSLPKTDADAFTLNKNQIVTQEVNKSHVNLSFKFNQLNILMITVNEEEVRADKLALFCLVGAHISLYFKGSDMQFNLQIKKLNVKDLNEMKFVFDVTPVVEDSTILDVNYKKIHQEASLDLSVASMSYLHSPKFIHNLTSCFKVLKNYQDKIVEEIKQQATNLAINLIKKGKGFIHESESIEKRKLRFTMWLQTPVIALPTRLNYKKLIIAHLGNIFIEDSYLVYDNNDPNLSIQLEKMSLFSVDLTEEHDFGNRHNILVKCKPTEQSILIKDTNVCIKCIMKTNVSIDVNAKIEDVCEVKLSKVQLELFTQALDNLVYDENYFKERLMSQSDENSVFYSAYSNIKSEIKSSSTQLMVNFTIKKIVIIFIADCLHEDDEINKEIADLELNNFALELKKTESYLTNVDMTLETIYLIDKLTNKSSHDLLLLSSFSGTRGKNHTFYRRENLSRSLPNNCRFERERLVESAISLPTTKISRLLPRSQLSSSKSDTKLNNLQFSDQESYENEEADTFDQEDPLVTIKLVMVDERHKQFSATYLSFKKFIKIKFSNLQLNVNPETWILLLDLLGKGSQYIPPNQVKHSNQDTNPNLNTSIEFEVKTFAIELNSDQRALFKININQIKTLVETRNCKHMKVNGKLGYLSIDDVSEHKGLYENRFVTSGSQALEFEFYKYDQFQFNLNENDFEQSLKLRMTSVKYLHTQRFISTLVNYFQQFNQLQDTLGRMRALSSGENVSFVAQRNSRLKLDIRADTPILLIPINSKSKNLLVFNLGNLKVENKFLCSGASGTLNYAKLNGSQTTRLSESLSESLLEDSNCLLDVLSIQLTDTDLYSATWHEKLSKNQCQTNDVAFNTFTCRQQSGNILRKRSHLFLHVERNLDAELSHLSPDWTAHAQLTSLNFCFDHIQYSLVREILDQNIGEQITQSNENTRNAFIVQNPKNETILTGIIWKQVCLQFDMENVGIELLNSHACGRQEESSFACLTFLKSKLIFENLSDGSKLFDLVSNQILMTDTRFSERVTSQLKPNLFCQILSNPNLDTSYDSAQLQLEIHYRSNKLINRCSILINNCRVIAVFEWIVKVKNFLFSIPNVEQQKPQVVSSMSKHASHIDDQKRTEFKLNLTNSDLVIVENTSKLNSQALILRLNAFMTIRPGLKLNANERQFDSCIQSIELFSCNMNSIEETALSIMDPVKFNIFIQNGILDVSTECIQFRFSYLDFELVLLLVESIKKQLNFNVESKAQKLTRIELDEENLFAQEIVTQEFEREQKYRESSFKAINVQMDRFCLCIIDDCKDVDVPLADIQFNRFGLYHNFTNENQVGHLKFGLNIDYYNRMLSGWEPFIEHWLARLDWKLKATSNCFTLTSMDILNMNLTNAFLNLIISVYSNWLDDYRRVNKTKESTSNKRHKLFQPYKLVNMTGSKVSFCTIEDTISELSNDDCSWSSNQTRSKEKHQKWIQLNASSEKEFNFFSNSTKQRHLTIFNEKKSSKNSPNRLRELVQHRIRIKIDDLNEIEPLAIDKVGNFYRDTRKTNQGIIRLIFSISLTGNAIKTIHIKSAVSVKNNLNSDVECKIETFKNEVHLHIVASNSDWPIPVKYIPCKLWCRPLIHDKQYEFSTNHTNFLLVQTPNEVEYTQHSCHFGFEIFYFFVKTKRLNFSNSKIPGHVMSIEPAVQLYNLLPIEFGYKLTRVDDKLKSIDITTGKIDSYKTELFHDVDAKQTFNLLIDLDNFKMTKPFEIQVASISVTSNQESSSTSRSLKRHLQFFDNENRLLCLNARIVVKFGSNSHGDVRDTYVNSNDDSFLCVERSTPTACPIKIYISATYCFFNLTGLPLIFKQAFTSKDAAGQQEEHELARSNQAFLFNYNDNNSPYACTMRVGRGCNDFKKFMQKHQKSNNPNTDAFHIVPKWCKEFSIESGSSFRALHVINNTVNEVSSFSSSSAHLNPDWVYYIGIDVKKGKGLLKDTNFIYFTTRFHLVNRTRKDLLLSQYFAIHEYRLKNAFSWSTKATGQTLVRYENEEELNCIVLLRDSMTQFHWPRTDRDQLLSVRLKSEYNYNWSGGFKIDSVDSFYVNLRDKNDCSKFFILRIEIILDGGTFFIVFSETVDLPPTIRIENNSEVEIYFYQAQTSEENNCTYVKQNKSLDYAWDEQIGERKLIVGTKGGTREIFDFERVTLDKCEKKNIYYENYIYIAFQETFLPKDEDSLNTSFKASQYKQLVLTVNKSKVMVARKQVGDRDQLWRMTADGLLVHEGSSAPNELQVNSSLNISNRYVLDLVDIAPQPNRKMPLTIRKPDPKRYNTQKWSFSKDGLLYCKVINMCLQIDGFVEEGSRVVLGPSYGVSKLSCLVNRQRLRPGSGHLVAEMLSDGPTRIIRVMDIGNLALKPSQSQSKETSKLLEFYVNFTTGIGVSLINWTNQEYEELLYVFFNSFEINYEKSICTQQFDLKIDSIQACNQLLNSQRKNFIFIQKSMSYALVDTPTKAEPALHINLLRHLNDENSNLIMIKSLIINMADTNVQAEEKLVWKLIQFGNISKEKHQKHEQLYTVEMHSLNNYYNDTINTLITNSKSTKYCFNEFKIDTLRLTLSVYKTHKLSGDLLKIKSSLGVPLIQFENARIELKAFYLIHEYDCLSTILNLIKKHYAEELKSHAMRILGSVDFLGNPLGLYTDFIDSVSSVLTNGDFTEFFSNLTHGVANSASKLTGSISNELTELTMDDRHQETRETIRSNFNSGSVDHFIGGALGFAFGVFGGLTSVVSQTYRGLNEHGLSGAFTGLGKGAIGTVSKPVVGILDLANGVASAIRDTSKTLDKMEIPRVRESRCCSTPGALLTPFSRSDSEGQKILYEVNNFNLNEKFMAMEQLDSAQEPIIGLVTNERVIFISNFSYEFNAIFQVTLNELIGMRLVDERGKIYIELNLENPDTGEKKNPRVKCENKFIFNSFANKVRFSKVNHDETKYAITNLNADLNED